MLSALGLTDKNTVSHSEKNRGLVYKGPKKVKLQEIDFPKFEWPSGSGRSGPMPHGAILKVILSGICGSDLHMLNGNTNAAPGLVFGHEITAEIFDVGSDVENFKKGDLVSAPFNIGCGRCTNCKHLRTSMCLNVNATFVGGAFGYVNMGGWQGGQAEYVLVPYADWNLMKLPPLDFIKDKLLDIALITDVFPTGFHAAKSAGVTVGCKVYIAGAGPVGLACAESCKILGAACVFVGDSKADRLQLVKKMGCYPVDVEKPLSDQIKAVIGEMESSPSAVGEMLVDMAIDCVGYEAHSCDSKLKSAPDAAFNSCISLVRENGTIAVPGVYLNMDPHGRNKEEKMGQLTLQFGQAWMKGINIVGMGQCPVMRYHQELLEMILHGRTHLAEILNATPIPLEAAEEAYEKFGEGIARKYFIDPTGVLLGRSMQ